MSMYDEKKARSLSMLGKIPGRIAITSDLWTGSNQKKGYITVTSHFIDESWQLQSQLLSVRKLSTLTLDNCSTNNSMIVLLLAKLSPSALIVNGCLFHMRCVAHILNLIVKSGLDVIESGIERIHDSVAFWTATPKRMEKFEEAAEQLNLGHRKRDILAIPILTVASESSFSTSDRIVSTHRNRLQPSTLEAIMCTQNWLWAGKKGNIVDGVGDVQVDDDNDNEMNETENASK
ncbi:hypothetical protein Ddye_023081 [Dipteronia dyeriana]|uniref:HAT C-terminal dimerisation domain-containing protein n=1 Tax=Dipteronia dyeriana TaxID=168575 RepID=A0AAD9TT88_9ROSI|nr:hypothetical protein Ddye_023081 [Dipteronia dyeriana]